MALQSHTVGWLVVFRINVDLAIFQPYLDLEAGNYTSLKFNWRGRESNPGPFAPQAKSLTTRPPLLLKAIRKATCPEYLLRVNCLFCICIF